MTQDDVKELARSLEQGQVIDVTVTESTAYGLPREILGKTVRMIFDRVRYDLLSVRDRIPGHSPVAAIMLGQPVLESAPPHIFIPPHDEDDFIYAFQLWMVERIEVVS